MSQTNTPIAPPQFGGGSSAIGAQVTRQIVEQLVPLLVSVLAGALAGLFNRKATQVPEPAIGAPGTPGGPVPTAGAPIPIIPTPTPTPISQPGVNVSRVSIAVQKAEYTPGLGDLYEGDRRPMLLVQRGENFSRGSRLWLDLTARDEGGEELNGADLIAGDLEYRTTHYVKNLGTGETAIIEGKGDDNPTAQGKIMPWHQVNAGGVGWGFRAWEQSVGMNAPAVFSADGEYEVWGQVGGVESNHIIVKVS